MHLNFYPPAPAPGPLSMLNLPQDDFRCEAKINGIRVIVTHGQVFTRQGSVLSATKGARRVPRCLSETTVEGEWEQATGILWVFDLPDHPGALDERVAELARLVKGAGSPLLRLIPRATGCSFRQFYEELKLPGNRHGCGVAEGVVLKRRASRYTKCNRANTEIRDWLKRRFSFDSGG